MHDVINQLFAVRDAAHRLHLKSKSFAQHVALGDYYEALTDKVDELAEVWQGQYGLMDLKGDLNVMDAADAKQFIALVAAWVESIKPMLKKEDTHILNIWDEIVAITYRAKYKLDNLA
jgi:hypothetical protein